MSGIGRAQFKHCALFPSVLLAAERCSGVQNQLSGTNPQAQLAGKRCFARPPDLMGKLCRVAASANLQLDMFRARVEGRTKAACKWGSEWRWTDMPS